MYGTQHEGRLAFQEQCEFALTAARFHAGAYFCTPQPYVLEGGPIQFFASSNVYLPTVTTKTCRTNGEKVPSRLPVGSLCLVDQKPRDLSEIDEKQQEMLKNLADMIGRELELGFEKARVQVVQRQTLYLGELFRSQMVYSHRTDRSRPANRADHHDQIAKQLHKLIGADSAVIIDLRSFHAPQPPDPRAKYYGAKRGMSDDSMETMNDDGGEKGETEGTAAGSGNSGHPRSGDSPGASFEPASTDGSGTRRPAYPRQLSSYTNGSAEWYSSANGSGPGGTAPNTTNGQSNTGALHNNGGGLGSVSVLGESGFEWRDRLEHEAGVLPAVHHFLVTFYSVSLCFWSS